MLALLTLYFNTSHVSINRTTRKQYVEQEGDFNTSHVSINRATGFFRPKRCLISIHLMFLLIWRNVLRYGQHGKFQYISCFY